MSDEQQEPPTIRFTVTEEQRTHIRDMLARGEGHTLREPSPYWPDRFFCWGCRFHIHNEIVHTEADCKLVQSGIFPESERIAIPQAIQEAFREDEQA